MEFSRNLAIKLSYLMWEVPGTPHAPLSSSTIWAHSCTRLPPYMILLQLVLLIYTLGKLCYGLVAQYRSTGARRSGMSHGWCAWTSAGEVVGHRKTHHTETLCLMTLWRKQGTRLSLLADHPDQRWVRLAQAIPGQVHFFLGSLNNPLFLQKSL